MTAKVSILISAFNAERFVAEALDSVLHQTLSDWELIITDDSSTDRTPEILTRYAERDQRIQIVRNATNNGVATSINEALTLAHGTYIARMDADDVMLPERLAKQVAFLDANPDIGVVGTFMTRITENGQACGVFEVACDHEPMVWALLFGNMLANPTTLLRRGLIEQVGGYELDSTFTGAEDYGLWTRMAVERVRFANLPYKLLNYRIHPQSLSHARAQLQHADILRLRQRLITHILDRDVSAESVAWLERSQDVQRTPSDGLMDGQIAHVIGLMLDLYQAMLAKNILRAGCTEAVYADLMTRIIAASRYSPAVVTPVELLRHWNKPRRRLAARAVRKVGRLLRCWPLAWT